jgi:hypothetical protein
VLEGLLHEGVILLAHFVSVGVIYNVDLLMKFSRATSTTELPLTPVHRSHLL